MTYVNSKTILQHTTTGCCSWTLFSIDSPAESILRLVAEEAEKKLAAGGFVNVAEHH